MAIGSELDRLISSARTWSNQRLAIATVVSTWGSAPRPRGSHMLVAADGRFEGSISGGCVETEVLTAAADAIASGRPRVMDFTVGDETAWEAHLPCGGAISVLVQPVSDAGFPAHLLEAMGEARRHGRTLEITTDLGSGASRIGEFEGEGRFINRYQPARRLLIVGAVQIAQALVALTSSLDVKAVVVDPRERFLTSERFPDVELDARWPDEAIDARVPDRSTVVVTLSHDPKIDDPALISALRHPTCYIAALGSRRSHAARIERLQAAGIEGAELARIDAPAGIDIGAIGPAEIALSIAAGMVHAFRRLDA